MRRLRHSIIALVAISLAAGSAAGASAQDDVAADDAAALVTGRIIHSGGSGGFAEDTETENMWVQRGRSTASRSEMSDPRLSGEVDLQDNADRFFDGPPSDERYLGDVLWGTIEITNDGGTWTGTSVGTTDTSGGGGNITYYELVGGGGYEGLAAVVFEREAGGWTLGWRASSPATCLRSDNVRSPEHEARPARGDGPVLISRRGARADVWQAIGPSCRCPRHPASSPGPSTSRLGMPYTAARSRIPGERTGVLWCTGPPVLRRHPASEPVDVARACHSRPVPCRYEVLETVIRLADGQQTDMLASAAAGDEVAFRRIIAMYHEDMRRVCLVIAGDHAIADEAVQAAWLVAWKKLHKVHGPERLRPWLVSVAVNEAKQLLRKRRRRAEIEVLPDPSGGAGGIDPATGVASVDLRAAILKLDPDARALIAMRYGAGFDSNELAVAMGTTRRRPPTPEALARPTTRGPDRWMRWTPWNARSQARWRS